MQPYVERCLAAPIESLFSSFQTAPIGSASIGQVYRARLKDGRDVAVKVQYPEAESLIMADVNSFELFVRLAQPELVPFQREMRRQLRHEFDFAREAAMQQRIAASVAEEFGDAFVVADVIAPLVHRRAFAMQFIQGSSLMDAMFAMPQRQRRGVLVALARLYGRQIFVDGRFQADPHPGNFLLQPDGRIALLDFGCVKELQQAHRLAFAHMVLAKAAEDKAAVVDHFLAAGFTSKRSCRETAYFVFDTLYDSLPRDNLVYVWYKLMQSDPIVDFPVYLVMLSRVGVVLRGLCSLFSVEDLSICQIWQSYAQRACGIKPSRLPFDDAIPRFPPGGEQPARPTVAAPAGMADIMAAVPTDILLQLQGLVASPQAMAMLASLARDGVRALPALKEQVLADEQLYAVLRGLHATLEVNEGAAAAAMVMAGSFGLDGALLRQFLDELAAVEEQLLETQLAGRR
eukprot:PLAT12457.6.p1 GENE.PLAT12457.6~~PLAT12457.6.p1  ORF type:complete len:459 (-),score=222.72 PLAT12457.6:101-1477(-)